MPRWSLSTEAGVPGAGGQSRECGGRAAGGAPGRLRQGRRGDLLSEHHLAAGHSLERTCDVVGLGALDEPEVAARVAWAGVGRRLKAETPSPAAVGTAVHSVLDDPRYRTKAHDIAANMARSDGIIHLAQLIDGLDVTGNGRTPAR